MNSVYYATEKNPDGMIRVREVIPIEKVKNPACDATCPNYAHPIDWPEIWSDFGAMTGTKNKYLPYRIMIQQLVEKQLKGEE